MTVTASMIGPTFITLMIDGKTNTITSNHEKYTEIRDAIRIKNFDLAERLLDSVRVLKEYSKNNLTVIADKIFYNGMEVKNCVVTRIFQMQKEGFDIDPMLAFLNNLLQNPSKTAVEELYLFLEATALPITTDGYFLAYKKVKGDYTDIHTGTFDNSVGKTLEMPRNQVDDNRNKTCSAGLHFCSLSYLQHFGGSSDNGYRVVIVKINPADVVSIPSDYNNAKGRAWKYEVVDEYVGDWLQEKFNKPVYDEYTQDDDYQPENDDGYYDNQWYDEEVEGREEAPTSQPRDAKGRFLPWN